MAEVADTRAQLLAAAVVVIAESGWAAATSRAVAERAGTNNALVHYYFGSVNNLRREAVTYALEQALAGPVEVLATAGNILDGLVETVAALRQEVGSPGQRVMVEALVQSLRDDSLRADMATALQAFRALLTERFTQNREAGLLRGDADPHALAVVFAALLDGLLLHVLAEPDLDVGSPTAALADLLRPNEAPTT